MSESGSLDRGDGADGGRRSRRRNVLIGGGVAILVIAAIVVAGVLLSTKHDTGAPAPSSSETPSATSTSTPSDPADPPTPADTEAAEPDRATLPPVPLDGVSDISDGPSVRVTKIEAVEGEAIVPGEVAGPALRVTVSVENSTADAIDLRTATVTLAFGDPWQVGNPITKPEGAAFPASVAPGETASGTFVFEAPEDARDHVRIELDLSIDDPIVAFEGAVR